MKAAFLKLVSPFLFVVFATVGGPTIAATDIQQQGASTVSQAAPSGPVDCKKTPKDPRCKDKK